MPLSRRQALLAVLALPLGKFNAGRARAVGAGPAFLSIPLDDWGGVVVKFGGKQVVIPSREIFEALKGD
jgi:hypothetical protein